MPGSFVNSPITTIGRQTLSDCGYSQHLFLSRYNSLTSPLCLFLQVLLDLAKERLSTVTKDENRYKAILEGLAAQCLCQLNEPKLKLRCRKADEQLVKVSCDNHSRVIRFKQLFALHFLVLKLWTSHFRHQHSPSAVSLGCSYTSLLFSLIVTGQISHYHKFCLTLEWK